MKENTIRENGFANGLTYLLIGGGIGAALALLFAPKSGSELRENIADVTRKGYDATLEKANDLKAQSADVIQAVKEKAGSVYDLASAKLAKAPEIAADVVSATTGAVSDGIERMQNEAGISSKQPVSVRKGSNIV
ncbi:MAG: YtxH domain-containing protein [Acidobacteriota bacterium]